MWQGVPAPRSGRPASCRSEEHTSELQSHVNLVCRLLLEKKKKNKPPLRIRLSHFIHLTLYSKASPQYHYYVLQPSFTLNLHPYQAVQIFRILTLLSNYFIVADFSILEHLSIIHLFLGKLCATSISRSWSSVASL